MRIFNFLCSALLTVTLSSCSSPKTGRSAKSPLNPWERAQFYSGRRAEAPRAAPGRVHAMVAAGNRIAGSRYRMGGGHRSFEDNAYDCSGAVSYVLHAGGYLNSPDPSSALRHFGEPGPGRWVTVYAKHDHSFIEVAGLRYDTSDGRGTRGSGPLWRAESRSYKGFTARHPAGL